MGGGSLNVLRGPQAFCAPLPLEMGWASPSQNSVCRDVIQAYIGLILHTHIHRQRDTHRAIVCAHVVQWAGAGSPQHSTVLGSPLVKIGFNGFCLHVTACLPAGGFAVVYLTAIEFRSCSAEL